MKKINFPIDAETFLINREPSTLINTIENASPESICTKTLIGSRNCVFYNEDGELPVMALLEIMVQSLSAWNSMYGERTRKKDRASILVKVERLIVTRNGNLPKGMELIVDMNVDKEQHGYAKCDCFIKDVLENEVIAQARLKAAVLSQSQINDLKHQSELDSL